MSRPGEPVRQRSCESFLKTLKREGRAVIYPPAGRKRRGFFRFAIWNIFLRTFEAFIEQLLQSGAVCIPR